MKKGRIQLQVGFGRIDITPSGSLPMGGYIERTGMSAGVHDPLFAKAVAFRHGKTSAVLISLDLLHVSNEWTRKLRKEILRVIGVPRKNVLVAATHTHSGPAVFTPADGRAKEIVRYEERLLKDCVKAARKAFASAEPSLMRAGSIVSKGVALNRRDSAEPFDDRLAVVRVEEVSGKVKGHLASFSCHPTVMPPSNVRYSADLFGASAGEVEKTFSGSTCIMFNGAGGDSSTRFTRRRQTWAELERLGKKLARQIIEAGRSSEPAGAGPIRAKTAVLTVPFRKIPPPEQSQQEYERALQRFSDAAAKTDGADTALLVARALVDGAAGRLLISRVGGWEPVFGARAATVELQVLRIGDVIICGLPGEFFGRRGTALAKAAAPRFGLVAGCANGFWGYVVPPREASQGGYELIMAPMRPSDEPKIIREATALIREIKRSSG
jgi:hypothetical protein